MQQTTSKQPRFIPNTDDRAGHPAVSENVDVLIQEALEHIISETPPQDEYSHRQCRGLFQGPTAVAYLFLKIGVKHPAIRVRDHSLRQWARLYMKAKRKGGDYVPCGLSCESAGFWAVQTMFDDANASKFCNVLNRLVEEEGHPCELLFGYSGLLYMIRAVESWTGQNAEIASSMATIKARIMEKILSAGPGWTWHEKRYIGAVHGDVGILTQLLLTDPKLAANSMVSKAVNRLLSLQRADGNWNTKDDDSVRYNGLVQFCHGAPGFVLSLLHLRRLFPNVQDAINEAIELGRDLIWQQGLLRKEPCLCHGILGNALALPAGQKRDLFLSWSLPGRIAEERRKDDTIFPPEDPEKMSTWFNYWPSVAWTWSQSVAEIPDIILYTDV